MTDSSFPPAPGALLVANLIAQIAFGLLAMTICLPSMQQWPSLFGATQAQVQLTFSGFVVAFGVMQLLYGPLSDRHGRTRVLVTGLVLALAGSLICALAASLAQLTAGRVLQGAGCAAGTVVGRAMVQDLFQGPARTRIMAYIGMAMGLCPPLGTVLGGQLHVLLGWRANFALMAVLGVAMMVAAWRGLPARRAAAPPAAASATAGVNPASGHWLRDMGSAYARLARQPAFLLYVAILGMTSAVFYSFLSGAPIVLGSYGVGPGSVGFYIMMVPLSYIGGNFLTSRLIRSLGERRLMRLGQLSTFSGIGLMLALGFAGVNTPLAFAMPLMLLGVGHGLLMPSTLAGTIGVMPALAGAAAAVAGLVQQLMGALGGYTVGLVHHDGPVNLGLLMIGFTACGLFAQLALHRRRPPAAPATGH